MSRTVRGILKCACHIMLALALLLGFYPVQDADACTRVLWRTAEGVPMIEGQTPVTPMPVIVGRTMDWHIRVTNKFRVFPRGIHRDGLGGNNSLSWTSKYGSLVMTALDRWAQEGMNTEGLSARLLYLGESDYGSRDANRPGVGLVIFVQYLLDNFKTVAEAVEDLQEKNVQIVPVLGAPHEYVFHFSIEDASGDSAIIEFVNGGQMKVYHNRDYTVMTNSPPFDQQLSNLQTYLDDPAKPLPGSVESMDRFVRAFHYVSLLYQPKDGSKPPSSDYVRRQAVSFMVSLLGGIEAPVASFTALKTGPTLWLSIMDLTNHVFFFKDTFRPNMVWVNMSKFNFEPGSHEREYWPEYIDEGSPPDEAGDISKLLKKAPPFKFNNEFPTGYE